MELINNTQLLHHVGVGVGVAGNSSKNGPTVQYSLPNLLSTALAKHFYFQELIKTKPKVDLGSGVLFLIPFQLAYSQVLTLV